MGSCQKWRRVSGCFGAGAEEAWAGRSGDPLAIVAQGLVDKLPALSNDDVGSVLDALHEVLDGVDGDSRDARTRMQMHLIRVADRLLESGRTASAAADEMLGTEKAARLMDSSRPYVAMLANNGRLPGAVKTEGGHRIAKSRARRLWHG